MTNFYKTNGCGSVSELLFLIQIRQIIRTNPHNWLQSRLDMNRLQVLKKKFSGVYLFFWFFLLRGKILGMLFKNWMRENTFVRQINPWKEGFIFNLYRFIGTNTVPITVETEFFLRVAYCFVQLWMHHLFFFVFLSGK